jgi:hypothetical protein
MDLSIVNHLFLTQRFLVKGMLRTGELRLSSFLNSVRRPLLALDHVTFVDLQRSDRITAKRATIRLEDVLLAHEYLDLAGDPLRKKLAQPELQDHRMVSAYFRAPSRLEVLGRVRRDVLESASREEFFVVMEPLLRGLEEHEKRDDLRALDDLAYAIVNRTQLHAWFEYE